MNPINYEPINLDTSLTQDSAHTVFEFIEGKVDNYYTKTPITYDSKEIVQVLSIDESITVDSQDEIELWEPVEMPDIPTRIADDQVIEKFMLEEEETDFQGIDECNIVELQNKQEIEECVVSEPVEVPDIPIRVVKEQEIEESIKEEECMKEESSDIILPEMCSTDGKICTDESKLEIPKINAVEISEMPSERCP